ncbi:MAG: hypothetical protein N2319_11400 [Candidatus Kapabacteria bacterium]|nr:hypothetical protein [Candidatus Kapabacteria bacterium]
MKTKLVIITFLTLFSINELFSQIGVYPPILFINPLSRGGMVTLTNTGYSDKEVEVIFRFGYVGNDENGNHKLIYNDTLLEEQYSLVPYIKAFPKKIIIKPQKQQVVRFLVRNISDKPDGTYWTRMGIRFRDPAKPVTKAEDTSKITAAIELVAEVNTLIMFQKGAVNAGVDIPFINTLAVGDTFNLYVNYERLGNSPFMGNVTLGIYDSKGDPVETYSEKLGVFKTLLRRYSFEKDYFPPGNYTVEFTITNERDDVPEKNTLKFNVLTKKFTFEVK